MYCYSMTDNEVKSGTIARNELSLRRLSLLEDFFRILQNVETVLEEYRCNLSKAKCSTTASTLIPVYIASLDEMNSTAWIKVAADDGSAEMPVFSLTEQSNNADLVKNFDFPRNRLDKADRNTVNANEDQQQRKLVTKFRPFGVFENQHVRAARNNIRTLLPMFCDLATIQAQVFVLNGLIK